MGPLPARDLDGAVGGSVETGACHYRDCVRASLSHAGALRPGLPYGEERAVLRGVASPVRGWGGRWARGGRKVPLPFCTERNCPPALMEVVDT